MIALVCDCGWKVEVLNPQPLIVLLELEMNLSVAVSHWSRGHQVKTHTSTFNDVVRLSVNLASTGDARARENPFYVGDTGKFWGRAR